MSTNNVVHVESLDQDGNGVVRVGGKVTFVEGVLPGESAQIRVWRRKPRFDIASAVHIASESSMRVPPRCRHFDRCGGCSLQHLEPRAQVAVKQRVLEDNLARIGRVQPEAILPPIHGPAWGYRQRARLSVRMASRPELALVGFRERGTHRIAEMTSCEVLPPRISALIMPLRELLAELELATRIPQLEVAVGEGLDVLIMRVLDEPAQRDLDRLQEFAQRHCVEFYLQPGGPHTLRPLTADRARPLAYRLPEFDLEVRFGPSDFTQVNQAVNRVLVRRAVALLAPQPQDRIADLFCGLGNFSLALARRGAQVTGVDSSGELVARAMENAVRNGLGERLRFCAVDLYLHPEEVLADLAHFDKMLIDPPRDGALALVRAIGSPAPRLLLYVSCNPATLARDANVLVAEKGFRFRAAGVINMFPHTSHVESLALFERE